MGSKNVEMQNNAEVKGTHFNSGSRPLVSFRITPRACQNTGLPDPSQVPIQEFSDELLGGAGGPGSALLETDDGVRRTWFYISITNYFYNLRQGIKPL